METRIDLLSNLYASYTFILDRLQSTCSVFFVLFIHFICCVYYLNKKNQTEGYHPLFCPLGLVKFSILFDVIKHHMQNISQLCSSIGDQWVLHSSLMVHSHISAVWGICIYFHRLNRGEIFHRRCLVSCCVSQQVRAFHQMLRNLRRIKAYISQSGCGQAECASHLNHTWGGSIAACLCR